MKKLILSALIMGSAATAVNAQANSVLVYGNIGYHSTKNAADDKTRSFNINPGVGYQFDNHWTVGVAGSFGTDRARPANAKDWGYVNTYSAGAFLRNTVSLGKIFSIFNQLNAEYVGSTTGISNASGSTTANGFRASLTPAVGVNVWHGFALNFSFGGVDFTTMKTSGVSGSNNSFNFTWGTQVNVGVSRNIFCGNHKHHHGQKMNHGSSVDQNDMKEDEESKDKD